MNKIGEMTFEEFKEALKIIMSNDDGSEKLSMSDKIKKYFQNMKNDFLSDCEKCKVFFVELITLKIFPKILRGIIDSFKSETESEIDKKDDESLIEWFTTPLTQEVFIKRGKKIKSVLYEFIDTVVFVLVMVIIIRFFIAEIRWIPSGSMHPTLLEGDRIVVERFSRFKSAPKRGDIMVFYPPSTKLSNAPLPLLARLTGVLCNDVAYIKRVIGTPGDKIEIKQYPDGSSYVFINDKKYVEPYIKSIYEYPACINERNRFYLADEQIMKCGPFKLKEDEYFMMGDNRGSSYDSRYWGVLKKDRFIGRAVTIFWPLNRKRILKRFD